MPTYTAVSKSSNPTYTAVSKSSNPTYTAVSKSGETLNPAALYGTGTYGYSQYGMGATITDTTVYTAISKSS